MRYRVFFFNFFQLFRLFIVRYAYAKNFTKSAGKMSEWNAAEAAWHATIYFHLPRRHVWADRGVADYLSFCLGPAGALSLFNCRQLSRAASCRRQKLEHRKLIVCSILHNAWQKKRRQKNGAQIWPRRIAAGVCENAAKFVA